MVKRKFILLPVVIFILTIFFSGCGEEEYMTEIKITGIPFGLKKASIKSINISKELIEIHIESDSVEHNVTIQPGLSKHKMLDVDELEVIDRYNPDGPIRYLKFISKGEPQIFLVKGGREKNILFSELTFLPGTPLNVKDNETDSQRESVSIIVSINDQEEKILKPGEPFAFHKDKIDWTFIYLYASVPKAEPQLSEKGKIASESPHFLVDWIAYRK